MSNSMDKSRRLHIRFILFVSGGFMDGWSRKTCPQLIYSHLLGEISCKRLSDAGLLWALHARQPFCTEMQTRSGSSSSCRKHLQRSYAHMSAALGVYISPEILDLREDIQYIRGQSPDVLHKKTNNKKQRQPWVPVLCQLLPWCRSLLFTAGRRSSCPGSPPGENRGSPHWSVLGEPMTR